jgi:predicted transcriptional regulator
MALSQLQFLANLVQPRKHSEGWVSVDEITSELEISRATYFRHLSFFRDVGFVIETRKVPTGKPGGERKEVRCAHCLTPRN